MENLELVLKSALPIYDIDQVAFTPNEGFVLAWVDAQDRPDLVAAGSLLAKKQQGTYNYTLFGAYQGSRDMTVGLRVEVLQPTHVVFHLAMKIEEYFERLSFIAQTGEIWVVARRPPEHLSHSQDMEMKDFMNKIVKPARCSFIISFTEEMLVALRRMLAIWTLAKNSGRWS